MNLLSEAGWLNVNPGAPVDLDILRKFPQALQQIRYDQRMAVAVSLDHAVFPIASGATGKAKSLCLRLFQHTFGTHP